MSLNGKHVLVTGGTGTFGRAFVPYVLERFDVRRLAVLSRDWEKQERLEEMLPKDKRDRLRLWQGDVADSHAMWQHCRGMDVVVHAAALKHIVHAAYNSRENFRVNVHGTVNVADAAIWQGVGKVMFISSDKAVAAVNSYGAAKAMGEHLVVGSNTYAAATPTRLSCVRYGNVLGARGSVMEIWRDYRGPLPITDPRMTRFVITVEQACEFVIKALNVMQGGEIFVPKLPACSIDDLAEALYPGRKTEYIGIRPGEKVHEMLLSEDEARHAVDIGWCYVIKPEIREWAWEHDWEGEAVPGDVRSDRARRLSVEELREVLDVSYS